MWGGHRNDSWIFCMRFLVVFSLLQVPKLLHLLIFFKCNYHWYFRETSNQYLFSKFLEYEVTAKFCLWMITQRLWYDCCCTKRECDYDKTFGMIHCYRKNYFRESCRDKFYVTTKATATFVCKWGSHKLLFENNDVHSQNWLFCHEGLSKIAISLSQYCWSQKAQSVYLVSIKLSQYSLGAGLAQAV
jgi:hypothetical protein